MMTVLTHDVGCRAEDVQGALQALHQSKLGGDALLAQRGVATQQYFLDAAAKRVGAHLLLPRGTF